MNIEEQKHTIEAQHQMIRNLEKIIENQEIIIAGYKKAYESLRAMVTDYIERID